MANSAEKVIAYNGSRSDFVYEVWHGVTAPNVVSDLLTLFLKLCVRFPEHLVLVVVSALSPASTDPVTAMIRVFSMA